MYVGIDIVQGNEMGHLPPSMKNKSVVVPILTTVSKSIDFFLFGDISLELGEISPLFFFVPDLRRIT